MSMSVSVQKSSTKTNIKHNNRTMSEKEQERNPHIDQSRSSENKHLVQKDLKELYEQEFGGALEKYNAKQKRHDRKIKNYYEHIKGSKKTSVQQEMIVQIGDKDDFLNPVNKKIANEILEKWFEDFELRNPNLKIYNAVIHNDEASPHLHLNFVPVAGDYKNGLEKQVSFDRAIIQQDSTLKKERPFDQWREKEVSFLEEKLNEYGIERKLVGKNNYKDVNEYKEKKDLEKEIQLLEKNIASKKTELASYVESVPSEIKVSVKKQMKNVEVVSKEKNIFGMAKKEYQKKPTGKLIIEEEDFKELTSAARDNEHFKSQIKAFLGTDLMQENMKLGREIKSLSSQLSDSREENKKLIAENKDLRFDIRGFKDRIEALTIEVNSAYKGVKDFVKQYTNDSRSFRNAFTDVVDRIKGKSRSERERSGFESPVGEFERIHKKETNRERNRGMER